MRSLETSHSAKKTPKKNGKRFKEEALIEAEKLQLTNDHFYFVMLGELYKNIDNEKAKSNLKKAYALAKTQTEKQFIREKIEELEPSSS